MRSRRVSLLTCVSLLALLGAVCRASPLFNVSTDGSGDEAELELLFPTSFSTRAPARPITAATGAPELSDGITTTMIRLKDYVLTRVVDFLQENLLIILVVSSLLIVMVFIVLLRFCHESQAQAGGVQTAAQTGQEAGGRKNQRAQEFRRAPGEAARRRPRQEGPDAELRLPQDAAHAFQGSGGRAGQRGQVVTSAGGQEAEGGRGGGETPRGAPAQAGGAAELQQQRPSARLHLPPEEGPPLKQTGGSSVHLENRGRRAVT
ncbi:unnamed protein product [Tetraodon nigroviridis]|uniref:(spotted green pufferfish) hypothetical protein n=1 Tax=Tetraodon nigroviridis TaxID=99883 RepID=Q4RSX8_TETNG|nr:unnamed protein product [Tetraodon nigroviridis]